MPTAARRTFSLLDAMVLIAATAIGLGGLRGWVELGAELGESVATIAHPEAGWSPWGWAIYQGYGLLGEVLLPFCCSWTLALLALRLRGPRPRLRRLARQPGAMACYSAAVGLIPALIGVLGWVLIWGPRSGAGFDSQVWERLLEPAFLVVPPLAGSAVLGSWATLLLGGRWRAERSWIDRAGRCLGVYWIGVITLPFWAMG
jgi:hypothetical protein